MKGRNVKVCVASLATEEGIAAVALHMAEVLQEDMLGPLLAHTPLDKHPVLIERFFSAVAGLACNAIGPEQAKLSLDVVRAALEEVAARRARANAH